MSIGMSGKLINVVVGGSYWQDERYDERNPVVMPVEASSWEAKQTAGREILLKISKRFLHTTQEFPQKISSDVFRK